MVCGVNIPSVEYISGPLFYPGSHWRFGNFSPVSTEEHYTVALTSFMAAGTFYVIPAECYDRTAAHVFIRPTPAEFRGCKQQGAMFVNVLSVNYSPLPARIS